MNSSKDQRPLKRLGVLVLAALMYPPVWAGASSGGDVALSKTLLDTPGASMVSSPLFSLGYAWGEPAAGHAAATADYEILSGYYAGRFGIGSSFKVTAVHVGAADTRSYFQDGLQVGVGYDAAITIDFSDQIDERTLASGLTVSLVNDHLGRAGSAPVVVERSYDREARRVTLTPVVPWAGNTLYDVTASVSLLSIDGFPLEKEHHIPFLTMLDPRQENLVLHPLSIQGSLVAGTAPRAEVLTLHIPPDALSDYSIVLFSRDPIHAPQRVDPALIEEATRKSVAAKGLYQVPVAIQEITVLDTSGRPIDALAKAAEISARYGDSVAASGNPSSLVRPGTLAFWVLDQEHRLWVKIPGSRNSADQKCVTAAVSSLSVFALMGAPDGNAADSYVFPVPWRPHGPNAGAGAGQSGTEHGGLTFTNLPSESRIRIYTLSGELIRELRHSDLEGMLAQERWDAKTRGGDAVASGVYFWRVDSAVDSKIGKLMIIR